MKDLLDPPDNSAKIEGMQRILFSKPTPLATRQGSAVRAVSALLSSFAVVIISDYPPGPV
jgi:hypothetical protein